MSKDKLIFELIKEEKTRQTKGIELIASENYTSDDVMEATGSILTNKYAEGYPGKRYYGGCEVVDKIELLAIERAKELFGACWANVQPHSGSQANSAVFFACLNVGDKILGFDLSHGGHLTHGSPVNFSGKLYNPVFYGVEKETGTLNYDKIQEIATREKPKMIIAGASAYSRDMDFERFRVIADSVNAILLGDISHPSGLIAKGILNDPIPHCHIVTTTTHKTLRGPRGGMIMTNDEEIAKKINYDIFPGLQGGPLVHVIAAKAVAFKEILDPKWKDYAKQVKANAKVLGEVLVSRGYDIVSGGTDNHLVLVSFLNKPFSGKDADAALGDAGITVNKNTVPGETRSPFVTSGIRIGSPALTARGMKEKEFEYIANKICDVLDNIEYKELHK